MNIKDIRRENARLLANQADKKFPIKGLAEKLGKPHALISHYIGKNPTKTIGEQVSREIEVAFNLPQDWLDTPHFENKNSIVSENLAVYSAIRQLIPVIGFAQLGDGGYWEANDFTDEYVRWNSDDSDAYAIQGTGNSMFPRIRNNEFVIVEPNRPIINGDEVFVVCEDGRRMVKIFLYNRDGKIHLDSTNNDFEKIVLNVEQVQIMHYVAGIAKSKVQV